LTDFSPAFLGMFESLRMGPTFARGRRDERAGHVRSLTVSGSLVVALVRGPDDPVAFRARIAVRAFGASEWARVEKTLVAEARYVADLLDGRMPSGIEMAFAGTGLSLLPLSLDEVAMDCTCERWPMPCAHLAATCYALARAFESDPFEVFTWRGRPRDELLMRLRRLREASAVDASRDGGAAYTDVSDGGAGGGSGGAGGVFGGAGGGFGGAGSGSGGSAGGSGSGSGAGPAGQRRGGGEGSAEASGRSPAAADPATFWGFVVLPEPSVGGPAHLGDRRDQGESGTEGAGRDSGASGERAAAGSPGSAGGAAGRGLRPDALLDQLDAPGLTHAGQPVTEVLRVAYRALPDAARGD
jgi:hypothetical protein